MSCTALNVLFLTALAAYGLLDFAFSCCHCLIPSLLLSSAYSALGTLAGTSVLLGALTTNGQALTMTNTAIAADLDEALDVHGSLAPEVALYLYVVVDVLSELAHVILGQIAYANVGVNAGSCENVRSGLAADTVNVGQADLNSLVSWKVNARNTCH